LTKPHRSVSQLKQYERCPHAYYLSRVEKVWEKPAAWLAQGSAVHEAAEAYEKSGRTMSLEAMQDVFRESYQKHINEACEVTPNFNYWFASGPYAGETDVERRFGLGLDQCEKYIRWYQNHPDEVVWVSPDGQPGIELGFDVDLDGVLVRGFIDTLIVHPEQGLIVRDLKTGNTPGDDFQLGVYSVGISESFGIDPPQVGDYFMGKSGKPTVPYRIGDWTKEKVTEAFKALEDNIAAGRFDPEPEPSKCRFCSVAFFCDYAT
jgi:putative RecB family exonuclease